MGREVSAAQTTMTQPSDSSSRTASRSASSLASGRTFDLDEYVYDALAAGADGFLLKDTDPAEILRAVHLVAAGSAMLHPTAARRLIDRYHATNQPQVTAAQARLERLTPRERDVLALLAQGDTNADIATRLAMRESTVKAHVSRILTALEVTNRVQAALVARDAGLTA